MSTVSCLNIYISSFKFDFPNWAQCSLFPHWNKMWGKSMLGSKSFGLIWLWVGPTKRNQELAQWRSHAPKARHLQRAAEEQRGLKLQRWNLLLNKDRPFSIRQWPAHAKHHPLPALLLLPSSCSQGTRLPAVVPASGTGAHRGAEHMP